MQQWRKIYSSIMENEDLGTLPIQIRDLKKCLILIADDDGRFKANARYVKAKVFPYDDFSHDQVKNWMEKLAGLKEPQLILYEFNGEMYGYHPNWYRFNKVRADRYVPSVLPPPPIQETEEQPIDDQEETEEQPIGCIEKKEKKEKKERRFNPPTMEEVKTYCKERGNSISAEGFINFYSSKGWMIGRNKMKDWRAAVRTWEQRDGEKAGPVIKNKALPAKEKLTPEQIESNKRTLAQIREKILNKNGN